MLRYLVAFECVVLTAITTVAMTTTQTSAQGLPRYATLYDCAEWTRTRQMKEGIGAESWLMGFLAAQALDEIRRNKRDILSQHDFRALLAWVDNYCQPRPLDNLLGAATALTLELINRAQR